MHIAGSMALYSSSPPATWSSQCSMSSKTSPAAAVADIEIQARGPQAHHHHVSRPVKGGLSSLFSNSPTRSTHQHACSAPDVLDSASPSCSAGSLRSNSQAEMARENYDSRTAAVNIPLSSSVKSREWSPVSVLAGPVSRSSNHGSPISLNAWESSGSGGLPPLDLQAERGSRRRSSLSGERDKWQLSRSAGFETGNSLTHPRERHSGLKSCRTSEAEAATAEPLRVEGFGSGSFSLGSSPLDTLTLPLYSTGRGSASTHQREAAPGILEAREKILRLAENANGLPSLVPEEAVKPDRDASTSADELLKGAQAKYKVFYDPCVVKAFRMAEEAHKGQFRRNGDSYLAHCLETALILAATGVGSTVVAAGLLHDAIDDSNLSLQLLRGALGEDVASLVVGVSKLSQFSQLARDNHTACDPAEADRLRTMILAMVDVRVVLIKIADRVHNMRTLGALPVCKQFGIARETLEIFAPLANRLGIWSWKAELEDLSFKCLKPVDHQDLALRLSEQCREALVMSSIQQLDEALRLQGVQFIDLCGRPKNLYSVYKKMTKNKRNVDEIFDVRGLRLIVRDETSCYKALEVVHKLWTIIPGKFKNYIEAPKPNGYKSLHTVVMGSDGFPLEVQIRTMEMHHQAEYGLAAHWRYKEDNSEHSAFSLERVEWARWVLTWHSEIMDTKLRVSPLGVDLRPPCPFPVHNSDCPYAASCSGPLLREDDPVFIIKVENDNMVVQELPPGSRVCDLVATRTSDLDSLAANASAASRKVPRIKVNQQFVDTLDQKLRMGDFVEVIAPLLGAASDITPVRSSSAEKPCGKIALEFQREQLKRLYLDGGSRSDETRTAPLERSPSVAGLM